VKDVRERARRAGRLRLDEQAVAQTLDPALAVPAHEVRVAGDTQSSGQIHQGEPVVRADQDRAEQRRDVVGTGMHGDEPAGVAAQLEPLVDRVWTAVLDGRRAAPLDLDLQHAIARIDVRPRAYFEPAAVVLQVLAVAQQVRSVEVHRLVTEHSPAVDLEHPKPASEPGDEGRKRIEWHDVLAIGPAVEGCVRENVIEAHRRQLVRRAEQPHTGRRRRPCSGVHSAHRTTR